MPSATFHFPKGFLWGTATSSHQVEGGNENNNWSAWEKEPGRIREGHKAGLAADWWGGRWKEDFDRAAETGQNAHRLSIEWSRVQPAPDRWDEDAIDYYREMIQGLIKRDLHPMVTLHHFTDPLWLTEMGGWENEQTPELFEKYARKIVEALKPFVTLWCTINEPNVYVTGGYVVGAFPPGKSSIKWFFPLYKNMLLGHALAYRTIHAMQPEAQVGLAYNYSRFIAAKSWNIIDRGAARLFNWLANEAFPAAVASGKLSILGKSERFPGLAKTQDYFGLNYYFRELMEFSPFAKDHTMMKMYYEDGAEASQSGMFANTPEGMFDALKWAKGYGLPIHITENGIEDTVDALRRRYIIQNLHQVWRAVNFCFPVRSYFHWSLVDNFEWAEGWVNRFGLWGLDLETQTRIRRKSVDLYQAICRENGISAQMVEDFSPEIYPKIYPE